MRLEDKLHGIVLAVAAAALAACSSEEPADAGTGPPASEMTVLLQSGSTGSWPTGLDPATNVTGGLNLSLMNAIFGGLFQLTSDDDGGNPTITGVLAKNYEIADGGRTLVILLREGVRFSDGTPFDAEAVRFNIERNIDSSCACAPTRWPWAENDRVTTPDAHTVELHFSRPYAAAINGFPVLNVNWIASPTALRRMGEEAFRLRPVGAGPFEVVTNELSSRLVLERNPSYWQTGRPYLDRLVFESIGGEQAAYLALLSGDADVAEGVTSTPLIARAIEDERITVTRQPPTSPYVVQLNTLTAPFDDERAREAIYHATDVEAIRRGLFNGWYPASQSFTAPGGLFHRAQVRGYRAHDLEKARRLVEELGGLEARLGTIQSFVAEQVTTALQSQWREAGIDVAIETHEISTLVGEFESGEWQAMLQTAGSYDPESASGVSLRFGTGELFSGVRDSDLDRILDEAAAAIDAERRAALYSEAARQISDNAYAPFLFAFAPTQLVRAGIEGPGLTTKIPPIAVNTGVLWQHVRVVRQ